MIVVADTSPLNYLVLIGKIELLPAIYEKILIPRQVLNELQRLRTPLPVRIWARNLPSWCEVHPVPISTDPSLDKLGPEERDAIQLALQAEIDTLLIDDASARRQAVRCRLYVTGTVAILEKAARRGLIDFRAALDLLDNTNFRLSASIRDEFLGRNP